MTRERTLMVNVLFFMLFLLIFLMVFLFFKKKEMGSGIRLTNEKALIEIKKKCEAKNIKFLGFNNQENIYTNDNVHLILKCNKCGNIWKTTAYGKFIRLNRGCPNCSPTKKLSESEIVSNIQKICLEKDFTFLGFNGGFNGLQSKLILRCNKCNEEWNTTTYNNFRKINRKHHTCGRKNPSHMPTKLNEKRAIGLIKKRLANTSLEFISFDENGYIGSKSSCVILKCKKCGKISTYSYKTIVRNILKCKNCEQRKFSNEYAIELINKKCQLLDYTFLGFNNKENKYDGKKTYLKIKCNKCGQIWESTMFYSFINTTIKCPNCTHSWKMEKEIETYLNKHSIHYIHNCKSKTLPWLKHKISLSLDFYLPEYNIAIECQGIQHYKPILDFGGKQSYKESVIRDIKKLNLCKNHNIKLLYYDSQTKHTEFLNEKVYNTEDDIINEILTIINEIKN